MASQERFFFIFIAMINENINENETSNSRVGVGALLDIYISLSVNLLQGVTDSIEIKNLMTSQ